MMNTKFKYATASEAIDVLRKKGFEKDFYAKGNKLFIGDESFDADDLKIAVTYRYEGNTDPADEVTVYGIRSNTGINGILVLSEGAYVSDDSISILKMLHKAKNNSFQNVSN